MKNDVLDLVVYEDIKDAGLAGAAFIGTEILIVRCFILLRLFYYLCTTEVEVPLLLTTTPGVTASMQSPHEGAVGVAITPGHSVWARRC